MGKKTSLERFLHNEKQTSLRCFHNCNENLWILDDKIRKVALESKCLKGIQKVVQKQLIDLGLDLEKLSMQEQPSPKDVSLPKDAPSPKDPKDAPSPKDPKDVPAETPNPEARPDTSTQEESMSPTSEGSNPFQQKMRYQRLVLH